jgi:hypothetical protein
MALTAESTIAALHNKPKVTWSGSAIEEEKGQIQRAIATFFHC